MTSFTTELTHSICFARSPSPCYIKNAHNLASLAQLFVFERNIQTVGGYHAHVQCIPMSPEAAIKVHNLLKQAGER